MQRNVRPCGTGIAEQAPGQRPQGEALRDRGRGRRIGRPVHVDPQQLAVADLAAEGFIQVEGLVRPIGIEQPDRDRAGPRLVDRL